MDASRGPIGRALSHLASARLAERAVLPQEQEQEHDQDQDDGNASARDSFQDSLADGEELNLEEEKSEGRRQEEELLEKYPLWRDRQALRRLEDLWQAVVSRSRRAEIAYRFIAVDTPIPFASSCPHGAVYFSRGLLENLNPEGQLFFAAHELAHTELRHFATRRRRLDDLRRSLPGAPGSAVRQRMEYAAVLAVRHQEEFEADQQAARWSSREIGLGALDEMHRLCQKLCPESLLRPTHPPFTARRESLDAMVPPDPLEHLWGLLG